MNDNLRPGSGEYDELYRSYVERVPSGDIVDILTEEIGTTISVLRRVREQDANLAYATGKWSIKELVGHMIDTERIFSCRALRFARSDPAPLPGFDQTRYVPAGAFGSRTLASLVDELSAVRQSSVQFFRNLPDDAWRCVGTAADADITVRALAFVIAGHELHHRDVLEHRYFPLVNTKSSQ